MDAEGIQKAAIINMQKRREAMNGASGPAMAEAPAWPLITYGDALTAKDQDYLVKGLVNRGEFSAWYGPPKHGKSFVVLDLMLHIAASRGWRGHRVRQGRVLYIALEGGAGIGNRLIAAQTKFGGDPLPFHVLTVPLDLLNGDAERLTSFIEAKVAELGRFDIIVLDTLSRSMPGADENSSTAITALIGVLDRLRAATGAHLAVIHHTGKDVERGMRGHSSLLGAVDLAVEIRDGTIRIAEARECPAGDTWGFDLSAVKVGTDSDGDPLFSCVVRELGEGEEPKPHKAKAERRAPPLGSVEKIVLDAVTAALSDRGKPADHFGPVARDTPRRTPVVQASDVEAAAERYMSGYKDNKRREAINRALVSLTAKRLIKFAGDLYWLPTHPSHGVA